MSFSADWLELREPFDHRSRATELCVKFARWLDDHPDAKVADLGGGTGSTVRALDGHCKVLPSWLILEKDPQLIEAGRLLRPELHYQECNLTQDLSNLLPLDVQAITASALIDLVSQSWLQRLVELARSRQIPLYIALTYDGRGRWRPGDLYDVEIKSLFDRHQTTDKGFGPALGPNASTALIALLKPLGGEIYHQPSDWRLAPHEQQIQSTLLAGYVQCALELDRHAKDEIYQWRSARQARIDAGQSRHMVGHQDILWLPTG